MKCPFCKKEFELDDLDDAISRKEALISSLCQECQNKTFKESEE